MVIFVPETTRLPALTAGSCGSARNGLNQVNSITPPRPARATAGTTRRSSRTRGRGARRSGSPRLRGPLAVQPCVPESAICVATVRLKPLGGIGGARPRARLIVSAFCSCGAAKNRPGIWPPRGSRGEMSGVREDILGRPAGKVEPRAVGQEAEAGVRQPAGDLAGDEAVALPLQGVQVAPARPGVGHLGFGQLLGPPVGQLLLLGEFDSEDVAHQVL